MAKELTQAQRETIIKNFTYHPPKGDQPDRYNKIRAIAKSLAEVIISDTPQSREQSLAITYLEQVVMWANASISRNE